MASALLVWLFLLLAFAAWPYAGTHIVLFYREWARSVPPGSRFWHANTAFYARDRSDRCRTHSLRALRGTALFISAVAAGMVLIAALCPCG
jgi:hypothetical protein